MEKELGKHQPPVASAPSEPHWDFAAPERPKPAVLSPAHLPSSFLSRLIFESHALRFSLELMSCFALYTALLEAARLTPIAEQWQGLLAWLSACMSVALFDHFYLMPPHFALRQACSFSCVGQSTRALSLLDSIAPTSASRFPLPPLLYHRTRASFLLAAGHHSEARTEIDAAHRAGLPLDQSVAFKAEALAAARNFDGAKTLINEAKDALGALPLLRVEEGLIEYLERKDLRVARRIFEDALKLPNVEHRSGISTHALSRAMIAVCRLWTGHAEEAIDELSKELERMLAFYAHDERARTLVSRLFLERAYYLGTHREEVAAERDIAIASSLCLNQSIESFRDFVLYKLR